MRQAYEPTFEDARHPVRRLLPPQRFEAIQSGPDHENLKLFAMSFMGWFVLIYGFIA